MAKIYKQVVDRGHPDAEAAVELMPLILRALFRGLCLKFAIKSAMLHVVPQRPGHATTRPPPQTTKNENACRSLKRVLLPVFL
jgi:hypothetical protein